MNGTKSRVVCFCVVMLCSGSALAQGTAAGPTTQHEVDVQNNLAYAGGPNDTINGPSPYPIDLDPSGQPWTKEIVTPPTTGYTGGLFDMFESIKNAGTETWHDWHEDLTSGALGVGWNSAGVVSAKVNGSPITFNQTFILSNLNIDSFSQPVLPGDTLELHKQITIFTDNVAGPGEIIFTIEQFPTPEPASAAMLAVLAMCGTAHRRNVILS